MSKVRSLQVRLADSEKACPRYLRGLQTGQRNLQQWPGLTAPPVFLKCFCLQARQLPQAEQPAQHAHNHVNEI